MSTGSPGDPPRWPDAAWPDSAVGRRVTVRTAVRRHRSDRWSRVPRRGGRPRERRGLPESCLAHPHPTGELVEVDPTVVVAAKMVPDAPARLRDRRPTSTSTTLEQIAAEGWQPLEQASVGDWVLRAAAGFTGRANSVLPLGDPGRPLDEALAGVSSWYAERSLPPKIQVPLPLRADLDAALDRPGLAPSHDPSRVQVVRPRPSAQAAIAERRHRCAHRWPTVTSTPFPTRPGSRRSATAISHVPDAAVPIMTHADHPVFVALRE